MATLIRRIVSGQKRRFQQDSFDLDLAYIAPRIIAMGLPAAQGTEVLYRNPMAEVARFVRAYHPGSGKGAKVYNLCSEHSYGAELLLGGAGNGAAAAPVPQLLHLPFDDHQVPALAMVQTLCVDAAAWLATHPDNVVLIHCKAGKGRTGVMICCLLLYLSVNAPQLANLQRPQLQQLAPAATAAVPASSRGGSRAAQQQWHPWEVVQPVRLEQLAQPPLDVLALYARRRTIDGNGVTISSQRRYVGYFWLALAAGPPPLGALPPPRRLQLRQVCISGLAPGTADSCELVIEARPSGSTAARGSLVCVRAAPRARAAAAAAAGGGGVGSGMPGLCGVPCCARPPLVQDDSCRISSGPDGDSLTFTFPAASQGLQAMRNAGTEAGAAEACFDDAAEGGSCVVEGDVRLMVTRGGARLFYTWFHTAFLPPGSSYTLTRVQLDKPHKALPQQLRVSVRYVDSQPTVQSDGAESWAGSQEQQQQLWAHCSEAGGGRHRSQVSAASAAAAARGVHIQQPAEGPFSDLQAAAAAAMAGGAGMAMPMHNSSSNMLSVSAPASPQARRLRSSNSWRQYLVSSLSTTSAVLLGPGSGCDAAAATAAGGSHTDAWAALVGGKAAAASNNWDWDSLSSAPDELISSTPVCSSGGGRSMPQRPAQQPATTNAASKHLLSALLLPQQQQQQQQQCQGTRHHRRHSTGLDGSECSVLDAADLEGMHTAAAAAAGGGAAARGSRHSAPGASAAAAIELAAMCRDSTLAAHLDQQPTPAAGTTRALKKGNSWSGAYGWFGAAATAAPAVGGRRSTTPSSQAAAARRTRTQPPFGAGVDDDVMSTRDVFVQDCLAPLLHVHPAAAPAAALPPAALAACDPLHSLLEALEWGADAPRQRWQQQQQPDGAGGSSRMRSAPCSPVHGNSRRGGRGLPPVSSSPVLHQPPAASSAPATPAAAATRLSSPRATGGGASSSSSPGLQSLKPAADGARSCKDQGLHSAAKRATLQSDAPGSSGSSSSARGAAHGRPKWAASRLGGCAEEDGEQEGDGDEAVCAGPARRHAGPVPDDAAAAADDFGRAAAAPCSTKPPAASAVSGVRRRSSVPGTSVQQGRRHSQDELLQGLLAAAVADGGGGGDGGSSGLLQPSASAPVGLRGGGSAAPAALTQQWQHLEKAWERSWWVV